MQFKLGTRQTARAEDLAFLQQLGYITDNGSLTTEGLTICTLVLVRNDGEAVAQVNHRDLLLLPTTQALLQALWGLKDITVEQAKMALVFAGAAQADVNTRATNFLDILNTNNIVVYNRKNRSIKLLVSPVSTPSAPPHIFIDRSRPYSNDLWIREILRECRGTIMWLDKYFQKEAFEWLCREANAENIANIHIVSVADSDAVDSLTLNDYKKLKKELEPKGISLEWKVLKRSESHDFHDRWVLDDGEVCYNLPSVGSIRSGQKSELHRSPNHKQIKQNFESYFSAARAVS
jgi:hypothetical protein